MLGINNLNKTLSAKYFFTLLFAVSITYHAAQAQRMLINQHEVDSVENEIKVTFFDKDLSKSYNLLASYYIDQNLDKANSMAHKAYEHSIKYSNDFEYAYACKNIGNGFYEQNITDSAFRWYSKAVVKFKQSNDIQGLIAIYNSMGVVNGKLKQFDQAAMYFKLSQGLLKDFDGNLYEYARLHLNLSHLYYLMNDPLTGLAHLDSANVLINDINGAHYKALMYANLGSFFSEIERNDKALSYLQKAIHLHDSMNNQLPLAAAYLQLGNVYQRIYNYNKAESLYRKSCKIYKSANDWIGYSQSLYHLGNLYIVVKKYNLAHNSFTRILSSEKNLITDQLIIDTKIAKADGFLQQNNAPEALELLTSIMPLPRRIDDDTQQKFCRLLSEVYRQLGEFDSSIEMLEAAHQYQDSIINRRHEAQLNVLKQEIELSHKNLNRKFNQTLLTQSQDYNKKYLFICGIVLVFIIVSIVLLFKLRKQKKEILKERNLREEHEKKISKIEYDKELFEKHVNKEVVKKTERLNRTIDKYKQKDFQLKKSLKEVEDANYLKNAFLSNMSHEIRTPLNGIIGFSSLLETELSLLENKELFSYAQGIQQSGERLLHLLNNIIDISRIEANDLQVSLQDSNVNQIIEKSSEIHSYQANEKKVSFNMKLHDTPMAYTDPGSLTKVLSDILDNAVKYTEEGFINITNGYDSVKKEVFIKIKDTGIGIDNNYLPKVFEAFRQESLGYSRAYQGAGLGLPLAKRLMDLMDGKIDIVSEKNVGTTVILYIPTREKYQHVDVSNKRSKQADNLSLIKKMDDIRVFLVEDDRMNRLVIKKMLSEWNVDIAEDGDICIDRIDKAFKQGIIYDIMLFDINLPNPWDGIKLMQHVKKKYPEYNSIPFIAQTAYAMRGDKERLLEEGFDDYISKPIIQQRLLTSMYKFLKSVR